MSETCPYCSEPVGDPNPTLADHLMNIHTEKINEAIESREPHTPTERVRRAVDETH